MRYKSNTEKDTPISYVGSDGHDKHVTLEPGGFYHLPEENGKINYLVITGVLVIPQTPEGASTEVEEPMFKVGDFVVCAAHGNKMTVLAVDGNNVICGYKNADNVNDLEETHTAEELTMWVADENRVPGSEEVE